MTKWFNWFKKSKQESVSADPSAPSELTRKLITVIQKANAPVNIVYPGTPINEQYDVSVNVTPELTLRVVVSSSTIGVRGRIEEKNGEDIIVLDCADAMVMYKFLRVLHNVQQSKKNKITLENINAELDKCIEEFGFVNAEKKDD